MSPKIVIENKDGLTSYDYRTLPLDTYTARSVGDVTRRHLTCRVNPNLFNEACLNIRTTYEVPHAKEVDVRFYETDLATSLPSICAACPAIPAAIRAQLEKLNSRIAT